MHRRHLLIGGASLFALSGCAATGADLGGAMNTVTTANEAAIARAVLRTTAPKAELLQVWTGPYEGVPPWDKVTAPKLREAILEAIDLRRAEINAIANNPEPATFANTSVAMQMAGEPLGRAMALFGVMTSNIGSDDFRTLEREMSPLLSAASDETTFNEKLFARIKHVADTAASAGLSAEQTRIAERSRDAFVRNGAALDAAGKAELGRINTALSNAFTTFGQKVVEDEKTYIHVTGEAMVAGLSAGDKAAAAAAAKARNLTGWAITNTRSSVDPFLAFGDNRAMREIVWRAFVNRGDNGDANDTNATIAEIVALRQQRAKLLGFVNHAEWRMQDTMAKTPAAAMELMNRVWAPAKARVAEEVADMKAIAGHDIEPWDYLYYAENVLASNNNNFIKAPNGALLISLDDAETLFHEFGHALHSLSSQVKYPALAGTPRDYVEYPSQVHEHWVLTRPIIDRFLKHVETGQPMPQELVAKVEAAATFNQGYTTVSYLSSALVDMDLHTQTTPPTDIDAFERDSLARYGMPKEIVMRHRLPQFNHLFTSDAYSAGYYSYLWSEVMDADTWAYFEESGDVFNPDIGARYKAVILAEGNTTDRAEAYRRFRGRNPDVAALLKVRGFPTN